MNKGTVDFNAKCEELEKKNTKLKQIIEHQNAVLQEEKIEESADKTENTKAKYYRLLAENADLQATVDANNSLIELYSDNAGINADN